MGKGVKGLEKNPVVIVAAARTPMGAFQGDLAPVAAPELGAAAIAATVARAGLAPETVDEVLMGCVLPAGLGQAPARQAALGAGLPEKVPATTVNKMCGSGMKTVMIGFEALHARPRDAIIAGGMESMSGAPYLLPKARDGMRLGHGEVVDHMFLDGLEDAYDRGRLMGSFAEDTAEAYQFTREAQDAYAETSLTRARKAVEGGTFSSEIVPVVVKGRKTSKTIENDESPLKADPARIGQMRPAFRAGGTVTAANSSSISDGAAALLLMRADEAEARGLTPLARIAGIASHAQAPALFTTAPIGAIKALEEATGWNRDTVDLYEINEAFAVVAMAALRDLDLDAARVNIRGGACALGHPIGASGARILVTLLAALEAEGLSRGVAALCIGGGEATAVAIERMV
ncbi:3-ketoacyl-CoA thiolase @ Acetyl-CoA acetyltransferase [hydrothermal vent metagenome]|uniref:3-ketoacyl-CoA thiolase @ Acetyl-CoA acetyltransferase n=1 Tax=hydrothermal vent metagenome TaxID=652676 RepID=A0A3B0SXH0_9ZZZZ